MNMKELEIVYTAIEKLHETTAINVEWENTTAKNCDGYLNITLKKHEIKLSAYIRKEIRNHQLNLITVFDLTNDPIILIAERIYPGIKKELRERKIAYLEANGNFYFENQENLIWIETKKPIPATKEKGNRAFTKTGLKVLFHFLVDDNLINQTYRQIANYTGVGLGNVNNIFTGLKETGFLLKLNQTQFVINNKKELLQKWATAYKETLQPTLEIGRFRFANDENFIHWRNFQLRKGETFWGGEPAGDLLTNYLRPGELTIYTTETRNELMRNYRLIPEPKGDVRIYKKFWNAELDNESNAVPPLLTYVDLINTGDKRCLETAEMIYKQHVEPNL
jgi:hypothetical protein